MNKVRNYFQVSGGNGIVVSVPPWGAQGGKFKSSSEHADNFQLLPSGKKLPIYCPEIYLNPYFSDFSQEEHQRAEWARHKSYKKAAT